MNEIIQHLLELEKNNKRILLSLYPPFGDTVIRNNGNRMFINEGADGTFYDISEQFYDDMVTIFDSQYKKTIINKYN